MAWLATQVQQSLKLQNDQIETWQKMRKIAFVPWQKMLPQQRSKLGAAGKSVSIYVVTERVGGTAI
jgi:hypothetical protein